jgi:hypothetical protein
MQTARETAEREELPRTLVAGEARVEEAMSSRRTVTRVQSPKNSYHPITSSISVLSASLRQTPFSSRYPKHLNLFVTTMTRVRL